MAGSIATGVMGQLLLVASGVVLARALGPENRGLLALVFVLSAIATQVGSIGVPVAVTYWLASEKATTRALLRGLRTFRGLQLVAILALQATLILVVLEPRSPSGFLWVAFLSLAATASGLSQMYGLAVLQGLRHFTAFNVLRTLNGALYLVGVLGLWAMGEATLTSVTLVVIAASVIAAVATWLAVLREALVRDERRDEVSASGIVSFGLRSLIGSSPPLETFRLDQLLVGLVLPPVALGYYVVALAFTNLTRFIGHSIGMITYPRVAAAADPNSRLRIIRHDVALTAAVCGGLTLGLVAGVPELLPFFFGAEFEAARAAAQILLVATFFAALRRVLIDGTRGSGQPIWGATSELVTLLALPAVVVATRYTDSLSTVAAVIAGANLLGFLAVAPALFGSKNQLESSVESPPCDAEDLSPPARRTLRRDPLSMRSSPTAGRTP